MLHRVVLSALVAVLSIAGTVTGLRLDLPGAPVSEALSSSDAGLPGPPLPPPPVPAPPPPPPVPTPPPPPPPPPPPVKVAGTPCLSSVRACVQLSTRRAWLISGGKVVLGPVPITSGKAGERTPPGLHKVLWKDADHLSREFDDAPMPWSVFFAPGGIAFHTGSLRAQSSGCVHLANSTAKRFFTFLRVGDRVQVFR